MSIATLAMSAPDASAVDASVAIDAQELLKLKGCGRNKIPASLQLLLHDDGRWSLTSTAFTLGGTYVAGGRGDSLRE